jgi:adenine-specific DNA-methyltransferase
MIDFFNNQIEDSYSSKTDIKHRRDLGQFFTPYRIAQFMSDWIMDTKDKNLRVLDPSTGFGIFERALTQKNYSNHKNINYTLWEIDKIIAHALKDIVKKLGLKAGVNCGDFMTSSWKEKYNGIISNPPYYKHHYIKNKLGLHKEICSETNFKFSLQTNIYCWFLIKAVSLLADGGRLAFIIPSEFLNSNYGERIKEYLLKTGIVLHLINIRFDENVFDNALTTSIIVLGEKKKSKTKSISFYNVTKTEQISDLKKFLNTYPKIEYKVKELDPGVKWRNYFIGRDINILNDKLFPFSHFGRFSRGIATGANYFFTLSDKEREINNIPTKCLSPCITKSSHIKNIYFNEKDFELLRKQGKKVFLFNGNNSTEKACLDYIKKGEKLGIDKVYLTRKRKPWYSVEKRGVSKIWVSVFGRSGLKFVWNTSQCLNLTCFHAFYPTLFGQEYLDILFLYLNTNFAKKLLDREKREYGNGLEKFEPNDINKAKILNFYLLPIETHERLAKMQLLFLDSDPKTRQIILEEADKIFNKFSQ